MADPGTVDVVEQRWLRRERAELIALLRGLGGDDWERPTECPAWNVGQVARHLLGDDLSLLARQRDSATNGLTIFAVDHPGADFGQLLDGFNEQWVTASTFLSTELLITLLELSGDWTADFYETIDLSTRGEPVGFYGSSGPAPYWQIASREFQICSPSSSRSPDGARPIARATRCDAAWRGWTWADVTLARDGSPHTFDRKLDIGHPFVLQWSGCRLGAHQHIWGNARSTISGRRWST